MRNEIPSIGHYGLDYLKGGRVHSLAHQLSTLVDLDARNLLEVGVGTQIVSQTMRHLRIPVTTVDIQADLSPDIVASVTSLPLANSAFDVSVCCQVLEHLPFEAFAPALQELRRVTSRALVLSLPDQTRYCEMMVRVGRRSLRVEFSIPRLFPCTLPRQRRAEMGHHWEIGFRGFSQRQVRAAVRRAGWSVAKEWRVTQLPWHRFLLLIPS